jgi:hypothetical protein
VLVQVDDRQGGQDADLGLVRQPCCLERQAGDEQRHREPDAGQPRHPHDVAAADAGRQLAQAQPGAEEDGPGHPDQLADHQPRRDPQRDPGGGGVAQPAARQPYAGVGQREQRDDDVAGPRVDRVLQPRRHRRPLPVAWRAGGRQQAEGDPGDRGVHAGLPGGEPHAHAERHVDGQRPQPGPADGRHEHQAQAGHRQPGQRQVVGVEHGDHDDGADVVDDGEPEQQHLQARRHPAGQQGEHAEAEGDVRRGGDAPAVDARPAPGDGQVDQGRQHHPAQRAEGGDRRGPGRGQLPVRELAPDLQPEHEEEQRHQPVVDRVPNARRPHVGVRRRPRRVGPQEGDDRGGEEQDPAGRLDVEEPCERADHRDSLPYWRRIPGVAHQ